MPHSDGAGQDALYSSSVEVGHNGGRDSGSSQFVEKVETLMTSLDSDVVWPRRASL